MLLLVVSWALSQSACPTPPVTGSPSMREAFGHDQPEVVLVPAAVSDFRLRNVPIHVCGYLVGPRGSDRADALEANGAFLMIEQTSDQPKIGQSMCMLGVIYRKDGLSEAESRAAGLPERVVVHGPSPDYVLYRCKDLEDCKELARTGPRGRRRAP